MNITKIKQLAKSAGLVTAGVIGSHLGNKALYDKVTREAEMAQTIRDLKLDFTCQNVEILSNKVTEQTIKIEEIIKNKNVSSVEVNRVADKINEGRGSLEEADKILNNAEIKEQIIEAKSKINSTSQSLTEALEKMEDIIRSTKDNFISLDLDSIYAFLDSLTILEETALFHILILILIMIIGFDIASVFFGNEVIKYFNLEKKYPKLTTFFKLRSQFKRYYLI